LKQRERAKCDTKTKNDGKAIPKGVFWPGEAKKPAEKGGKKKKKKKRKPPEKNKKDAPAKVTLMTSAVTRSQASRTIEIQRGCEALETGLGGGKRM